MNISRVDLYHYNIVLCCWSSIALDVFSKSAHSSCKTFIHTTFSPEREFISTCVTFSIKVSDCGYCTTLFSTQQK